MKKIFTLGKNLFLYFLVALISIGIAYGNGDHDLEEAKELIDSKIPCSQLTEYQLEHMGDYYMEQMHPGEAHEVMDDMMGGEGSESLGQMHIAIAKRVYCNDVSGMANYGMMGMMGFGNGKMMGYGFGQGAGYGPGMMGYGYGYGLLGVIFWILLIVALILLIIWLIKSIKKNKHPKGKKIPGGKK